MASISREVYNTIQKYSLIDENDKIALGLSGGKDSFALLSLLSPLRKKLKFEIKAFHVIPRKKYNKKDIDNMKKFCDEQSVELIIKETNIIDYIEGLNLKKDICFLCAHHRRKELFLLMEKYKLEKIALGHHRNDAIETFIMNIFYSGQTCTMMPIQSLFRGKINLIRPLYTLPEKRIKSYVGKNNIPVFDYKCHKSGNSKRNEVKEIIKEVALSNKRVEYNIFNSMHNVNLDYLPLKFYKK
ncbi:MAG: tRNA lysidine(34) synthetase TilS [Candidatus Muiribacteriota bacterium]